MRFNNITKLLSSCLATGAAGTLAGSMLFNDPQPADILAVQQLGSNFHGAPTLADYDMEYDLWTEDAEFHGGPTHLYGRDDIVQFFTTGSGWGTTAALSSNYKTTIEVDGNVATLRMECIILNVTGDPVTTPFSSIPPGTQNPNVEIFQHSNTTITAVKSAGVWKIKKFEGAAGPIL